MAISTRSDSDKKDKPEEIVGPFSVIGFLERRAEQIMDSRQAIARIASAIHDTMLDISNLLTERLTAGGQAELERAVGNLQGLTKAADQASVATPSGSSDSSTSRGSEIDLTGIKAAVDTRRDLSNASAGRTTGENGLENADGKTRRASVKAKALSALDATMAVGEDKAVAKNVDASSPSDGKLPVSDAPVSKADRFKQAFATADSKADTSPSASSDLPLPTTLPGARSKAALLKLDHAEATHPDPTSKTDVSAPAGTAIEAPKEGMPKAQLGSIQSTSTSRKPPAPAAI